MKNHSKFLICLLRACGLSLLSQEDIDDPKCNKRQTGVSVMSRKETDYEN
jgi:hypothetical protein